MAPLLRHPDLGTYRMIRPEIRRRFWLALLRRKDAKQQVTEEIEHHLALRTAQLVERGLQLDAARQEAERRFGSLPHAREGLETLALERYQAMRKADWWNSFRQDVRYAARGFRNQPGFYATVVLLLGLGIGVNLAAYGVVERLLLTGPSHLRDAKLLQRVYVVQPQSLQATHTSSTTGYVTYEAIRNAKSLSDAAAYTIQRCCNVVGSGAAATEVTTGSATAGMFPMLGVSPVVGRFFTDAEDAPHNARHVVVLGYGLWQRLFAADPKVIGQTLLVSNVPYDIIGVAPRGFTGPQFAPVDIWLPLSLLSENIVPNFTSSWNAQWVTLVARTRPGFSPEQRDDEITRLYRDAALAGSRPNEAKYALALRPLLAGNDGTVPAQAKVSGLLAATALALMLIACANVMNLQLSRAVRRRREIALRLALGAGVSRLRRMLTVEGALLGLSSAAISLGLLRLTGATVRNMLFPGVDWSVGVIDLRTALIAAMLACVVVVFSGLAPALRIVDERLAPSLISSDRGGNVFRGTRRALTTLQGALSALLLVGAGLFVRSLNAATHVDLGFRADRVLVTDLSFAPLATEDTALRRVERVRRRQVFVDAAERLSHVPGVQSTALAIGVSFRSSFGVDLRIPGLDSVPRIDGSQPSIRAVSPGYFAAVGTRILQGTGFSKDAGVGTEPVAIVSESMAQAAWPGASPLGKCLIIGNEQDGCTRVIGVAQDTKAFSLRDARKMHYYIPFGQQKGFGGTSLLVRSSEDPYKMVERIRSDLFAMEPQLTFVKSSVWGDDLNAEMQPWRLGATAFSALGVLALLVAAAGLFSLVSFGLTQRQHEIGVRLALGASPTHVAALLVREAMRDAILGIAIGLLSALLLGRNVADLLFETSSRDPFVFAGVAVTLAIAAALASLRPALRARHIQPLLALRSD